MPTDQLKEAHAPLFEDNTSYHDPLKELEEWAETQKLLSRLANSGPHRTSASVYNECYQEFCNHVLAKIAEMRENKK